MKKLLLLDYDGTIAPFKADRQKAFIHPKIREELVLLLKNNKTKVVIISGRALKNLLPLLDLPVMPNLFGSHGLERLSSEGYRKGKLSSLQKKGLLIAKEMCEENLDSKRYEIKPFSVAVHVRGLKTAQKKQILKWFWEFWKNRAKSYDLEMIKSSEAAELRLKGKNKGTAVAEILKGLPKEVTVAYLGDDMTDEDGFAALGERGLKVIVGKDKHPTKADIRIKTYGGVAKFIQKWRESL